MLLLALLTVTTPAQATVRIVGAASVSKDQWERSAHKRETIRVEDDRSVKLRLIEFE